MYYLTHLLYPGLGHNYFAKSVAHVFRQFLGQLLTDFIEI